MYKYACIMAAILNFELWLCEEPLNAKVWQATQFQRSHFSKNQHTTRAILWSDETKILAFDQTDHLFKQKENAAACRPENII